MQRFFIDFPQRSLKNALATAIAILLLIMLPRCLIYGDQNVPHVLINAS